MSFLKIRVSSQLGVTLYLYSVTIPDLSSDGGFHYKQVSYLYISHKTYNFLRVYGQFCIETIHGRLKRNREFE